MSERVAIIFDELSQLCSQYRAEVPGGRRAWPRSVKERIFELRKMGLSYIEISKKSGIPASSIYAWSATKKGSSFVPVKVVKSKRDLTVRVRKPIESPEIAASPTVTVVTPSGFRIEGLKLGDVPDLFLNLERRGAR
jgi:hypothetical protein